MTLAPPDPSLKTGLSDQIRQEIVKFMSDPLAFPDEMTAWLTGFISLNQVTLPTNATTASPVV